MLDEGEVCLWGMDDEVWGWGFGVGGAEGWGCWRCWSTGRAVSGGLVGGIGEGDWGGGCIGRVGAHGVDGRGGGLGLGGLDGVRGGCGDG